MKQTALPELKMGLVIQQESDQWTILKDSGSEDFFVVNPTGNFILERLRAGDALTNIAGSIGRALNDSPKNAYAYITEFLRELEHHGLMKSGCKERQK